MFKNKIIITLLSILLLAFFLRTFRLDQSPPRLTHDEMSIGYNSFSILKTGKDEWGRRFPLDFEAFGDHKLPGYIYVLVPFLNFLELNAVSIKIPSIIAGLFTIIAIFLLTKLATKSSSLALLTALILAISPWAIHISRMALESNLALTCFSWGLYFIARGFSQKNKNVLWLILGGVFFGLTMYFYVAYRLLVVLILLSILILGFIYKIKKNKFVVMLVSFVIIIAPLTSQFLGKSGTARFSQVSIFSDDGISSTIQEQNNFCFLSQPKFLPKVCRAIYSRPLLFVKTFSKNYLSFLLPTFLFVEGDQLEYLNNPNFAEFYLFLTPFYLVGIYGWYKKKSFGENLIKTSFLLAPIPSALVGDPQIVRGSALLVFIALFTATGIYSTLKSISKSAFRYAFFIILAVITCISLVRFFISYVYIYPGKHEAAFYPLPTQVAQFSKENEDKYDTIYIHHSNYPDAHILIAFEQKIDPQWYQDNIIRPKNADGFGFSHPTQLGKYQFGDLNLDKFLCDKTVSRTLYINNYVQNIPQWTFKDFSRVHTQAQIFDIDMLRDEMRKLGTFATICPNY